MFKEFEDALKAVEAAKAQKAEAEKELSKAVNVLTDATNKASALHSKIQAEVGKLIPVNTSKVVSQ